MREDMAGRLVARLLLPVMLIVATETNDLETIEILIEKSPNSVSAFWDWNYECPDEVTYTATYKKLGAPDNESQECVTTEQCSCEIPYGLLDHSHNYTLLINATTPGGKILLYSKDFDPNCKIKPPTDVHVNTSDALVIVTFTTSKLSYIEEYNITFRRNDSKNEKSALAQSGIYIIPPNELLPEHTYCLKVNVYNKQTMELSVFSPEECFMAPARGPPDNLRMEALDSTYLLNWDWDFDRSPNPTFTVEKCHTFDSCAKIKGCENITTTQCDCSELLFIGNHILRVSVYDSHRQEKSANVIQFHPSQDTVISPPKDLKMGIKGNKLFINVSAPEGFNNSNIYHLCDWLTHLEYWTKSTQNSEVTVQESNKPFFSIESIEASTTYCAKAKMTCNNNSNRSSLYGEEHCITSGSRSYLVAWIFMAIVVISVVLYICFCNVKRYIKHIFFPSSNLPPTFHKGLGETSLNCNQEQFLLPKEEATDRCCIDLRSSTEDLVPINGSDKSQGNSQDSGNYSNEGHGTQ
ncbi:interferon alpha/beta receptor 1-like [Engystomops pustulosus]|uniref:interferon alpha/beta receptor 1-like n=1 Tax=Engystomops pustulosus TaxID=76066 RepID=UPI003AFB80F3